jgi:hypothetical protein
MLDSSTKSSKLVLLNVAMALRAPAMVVNVAMEIVLPIDPILMVVVTEDTTTLQLLIHLGVS